MVQLSDNLVLELDEEARHRNLSRSALIREILTRHLRERAQASVGRRIADGYRRMPPGQPDEWGDLASLTDRTAADLLTRLDTEESVLDETPW
jgi:hypothetical protein